MDTGDLRPRHPRARPVLRHAADGDRPRRRRARRPTSASTVSPQLTVTDPACALFEGLAADQQVWMSHRDSVGTAPAGFAWSHPRPTTPVAAMADPERRLYATQFHPEVAHTPAGLDILKRFLYDVAEHRADVDDGEHHRRGGRQRSARRSATPRSSAACRAAWTARSPPRCAPRDRRPAHLRLRRPRDAAAGRGRRGRARLPRPVPRPARPRATPSSAIWACSPESPIPSASAASSARTFWKVFFDEATRLEGVRFLAQGTLYPDVIESGTGKSDKIKSHHNLIPFPEGVHFELVEPLRTCSRTRCAPSAPNWGCRTTSCTASRSRGRVSRSASSETIDAEKLDILRRADAIVREEIGDVGHRSQRLAVLRGAARHPQRRRHGRRADLRAADHHPRRVERRCDDRRLGAAAARTARQDEQPHHQRGGRHQPRGVRHHEQAAGHHRVGIGTPEESDSARRGRASGPLRRRKRVPST